MAQSTVSRLPLTSQQSPHRLSKDVLEGVITGDISPYGVASQLIP